MRRFAAQSAVVLSLLVLAGCATFRETILEPARNAIAEETQAAKKFMADSKSQLAEEVEESRNEFSEDVAEARSRSAVVDAVLTTSEVISPRQEHFLGRVVGAAILDRYPPAEAPEANRYLNTLGQALAMASERPNTYGGYRFALTDSEELHAFAAPGGFIFVSKGMFDFAGSEEALAGILAHEIAHIQHKHALKMIKSSRATNILLSAAAEELNTSDREELQRFFGGAVEEVLGSLVDAGFSSKAELAADATAVEILQTVGYEPQALTGLLIRLEALEEQPEGHRERFESRFLDNHPPAAKRVQELRKNGVEHGSLSSHRARQTRFDVTLAALSGEQD